MSKILIVEDDSLMLRMYERIFALENFTVDAAHNGEEGLQKVTAFKPDLILLDIMMPKMNGLQTLEALKGSPATQSIPVIVLTNLAGQEDTKEALAKGAAQYIIKSEHEPKQIVEMVEGLLSGKPTAQPQPTIQSQTPVQQPQK
jgi:CheY-like chemotaxis protein